MGIAEMVIGSYQVDQGKKAMKRLEAQGVSPVSPEYQQMLGLAEKLAERGYTEQQISDYLLNERRAANAANYAASNAGGGQLSAATQAGLAYNNALGRSQFAANDAQLKQNNISNLQNVNQIVQQQKNLNQDRYDRQYAAAFGQAATGAANVATGITDIKNTVLGSFTGGGGNTGQSGVETAQPQQTPAINYQSIQTPPPNQVQQTYTPNPYSNETPIDLESKYGWGGWAIGGQGSSAY